MKRRYPCRKIPVHLRNKYRCYFCKKECTYEVNISGIHQTVCIGEYYEDDGRNAVFFNNVVAIILWPLTAFVFFVIETFEYVRQKLNNKKE